jgi:hypothetical protein
MRFEIALGSAAFFVAAIPVAIRSWRLARWVPIDAEVVHYEPVGPFGLSPSRFARQLELQKTGRATLGPEIVYYAALVYVVNGVPHFAELTFDGPPDRKFCIRFNPANPANYTTSKPSYGVAIALACLGLAALLYSLS